MLETIVDPHTLAGIAFGFAACGILIVSRRITAASGHSEKWRAKHRDTLLAKLQAAGLSAYTPIVTTHQLKLITPLTHDELVVLRLNRMVIFDSKDNPVTGLLPLTSTSDAAAEYRRGQFRVITGSKNP